MAVGAEPRRRVMYLTTCQAEGFLFIYFFPAGLQGENKTMNMSQRDCRRMTEEKKQNQKYFKEGRKEGNKLLTRSTAILWCRLLLIGDDKCQIQRKKLTFIIINHHKEVTA